LSDLATKSYWESRYRAGGNSGAGSYGRFALYKAGFLNRFVARHRISSVAELGCGDGEQLKHSVYPVYTGYDIAEAAIDLCRTKFAGDSTKTFHCLTDVRTLEPADLCLSLDVIYHLLDDTLFQDHLESLFRIAHRYAIIYGNGCVRPYNAGHVRLRNFSEAIRLRHPDWTLVNAERNPFYSEAGTDPNFTWSNFYVYEAPRRAWHQALSGPRPLGTRKGTTSAGGPLSADLQGLLPLAAEAPHVLAIQPFDASLLRALLQDRPSLTATVLLIDTDMTFPKELDAVRNICGDRVTLVRTSGLAAWLTRGAPPAADLILLSSAALGMITIADLRVLVQSFTNHAIVVAELLDATARMALHKAIANGYMREILPEMRGADSSWNAPIWVGSLQTQPKLIVSLTSIKSRIVYLKRVIGSILSESRTPDQVVLHLSEDPYLHDDGVPRSTLPAELLALEEAGLLEIRYVKNIGPYRKLLPILRAEWESNCVIVTADDDTIYPPHWLDEMFIAYLKHRAIVAYRWRPMGIRNGRPLPYADWGQPNVSQEIKPEYRKLFTFPTGKDGILYHPAFFTEHVFDPELIKLAPTADDMTFKLATMVTATPVVVVARKLSTSGRDSEFPLVAPGVGGLWEHNKSGPNDDSMRKLLNYLGEHNILHLRRFLQ
jgi:DNA-binding transcriptional ArsR family regulator